MAFTEVCTNCFVFIIVNLLKNTILSYYHEMDIPFFLIGAFKSIAYSITVKQCHQCAVSPFEWNEVKPALQALLGWSYAKAIQAGNLPLPNLIVIPSLRAECNGAKQSLSQWQDLSLKGCSHSMRLLRNQLLRYGFLAMTGTDLEWLVQGDCLPQANRLLTLSVSSQWHVPF